MLWVQIPPEPLKNHGPEAQTVERPVVNRMGAGASLVRAACIAEWTGGRFPAQSHKLFDAGSNPASATYRVGECPAVVHTHRRPGATPGPGTDGRVVER